MKPCFEGSPRRKVLDDVSTMIGVLKKKMLHVSSLGLHMGCVCGDVEVAV
jgi:hypothetical protein